MNETLRTGIYVVVAAAIGALAWAVYPTPRDSANADAGERDLCPDLTGDKQVDTLDGLSIMRFDETQQVIRTLELSRRDENWVLTGREQSSAGVRHGAKDYPAGIMDRVASVASSLVGVKILSVVSENSAESGDHQRFGVVEPKKENLESGATGFGVRVTAKAGDSVLADVILGKPVDESQPELRYVRSLKGDQVFTAKIPHFDRFSTKFDDWIKATPLDITSSSDIRRLQVADYTLSLDTGRQQQRARMMFSYDSEKFQWKVDELLRVAGEEQGLVAQPIGPKEELNTQAMNDLTYALGDLRIVDAERKPIRVRQALDLKTGQVRLNLQEGAVYPTAQGFYFVRPPQEEHEQTMSVEGEIVVTMKDGVEYVLHFGNPVEGESNAEGAADDAKSGKTGDKPTGKPLKDAAQKTGAAKDASQESSKKTDPAKKGAGSKGASKAGDKKPADQTKLNRYLFVTARFNENALAPPPADAVPPEPADTKPAADDKKPAADKKPVDVEKPADGKQPTDDGSKPADGAKPKDEKSARHGTPPGSLTVVAVSQQAAPADGKSANDAKSAKDGKSAKDAKPAKDTPPPAKDGAPGKGDQPAKPPAKPPAKQPAKQPSDKPSGTKAEGQDAPKVDKKAEPPVKNPIEEMRKQFEAEKERKKKEHDDAVAAAKKRVKQLNAQFADWYYVISEDTFNKIHLSRDKVVKMKETPLDHPGPLGSP